MANFGPSRHAVHSFEADDLNFERLNQNVQDGNALKISAHNVAVSNRSGVAEFTRNQDHGTNHLGIAAESGDSPETVYEVPVTSLDDFAEKNNIDAIEVLKIDVEGSDIDVLRGAEKLLQNGRIKVLVVEIPLLSEKRAEMQVLLSNHGYPMAYIVRNSAMLAPATETTYSESKRAPLNAIAARSDLAIQMGITF